MNIFFVHSQELPWVIMQKEPSRWLQQSAYPMFSERKVEIWYFTLAMDVLTESPYAHMQKSCVLVELLDYSVCEYSTTNILPKLCPKWVGYIYRPISSV